MEALFHLRDYGYEHLTELSLDGLLTRLTETTWVRRGAVLGPEDRMAALQSLIPPGLVLSHDSAWWVHLGLGRAPTPLSFITHPRRRFVADIDCSVWELNLARNEWDLIAEQPVTTVERTLYDLFLPHVRNPNPRSPMVLISLIEELPPSLHRRFGHYLDNVSRRPYVARMRIVFDQLSTAKRD